MNSNPQQYTHTLHSKGNSPEYGTRNANYPRFYTLLAKTPQEEAKIKAHLLWRQGTSMPVVKVVNFTCQTHQNDEGRYWVFQVQTQPIINSIIDINNLENTEAMYLIREFLLGIQTISIKFNCQFDINSGFYGINNKGQAKVWSSASFLQQPGESVTRSMSFSLRKVNHAIANLFGIVGLCVKPTQKATFEEIGFKLAHDENITYSDAQSKLRKICAEKKLFMSNCLCVYRTENRPLKIQRQKQNKKSTPLTKQKATFPKKQATKFVPKSSASIIQNNKSIMASGYNSPSATQKILKLQQRWQPVSKSKPKVTWRYTNSANNQCPPSVSQNRNAHYKIQTANNSIKKNSFYPSMQSSAQRDQYICRTVPINFETQRLNSENMKNMLKQPARDQVTIKQFNPLEQADQDLQVSRDVCIDKVQTTKIQQSCVNTANSKNEGQQSKIEFEESVLFDNYNCVKKSSATTQMSSNTHRGKDSIQDFKDKCYNGLRLEEMIDNTKNIMDSILVPSPLMSRRAPEASRTTYNFGGLIPIEVLYSEQSEISGKQVQSLQASRDISQKINAESRQRKQPVDGQIKIDFDLLCGIDLTARFFADDGKDLKESVWCGEEKRAEHLQIKLSKLGRFGREINASFVPNQ